MALNFALTRNPKKQMVLFGFCILKYYGYAALRMNSGQLSTHPHEREILLCEGAQVAVLGLEDILIDNDPVKDSSWASFYGKKVTVVYLFHA